MRPRSDTVARMFSAGWTIANLAQDLRCTIEDVEDALRRSFDAADRKRRRK